MAYEINVNANMASKVAAKKAAEIKKAKQEKFESEVQGIINVVTRHVGEAMERGEFKVEIYEKEVKSESIISMALSSKKDDIKPAVAGDKEVILEAINILRHEGGFKISTFKENESHPLPYFMVEWPDPEDDDSTK